MGNKEEMAGLETVGYVSSSAQPCFVGSVNCMSFQIGENGSIIQKVNSNALSYPCEWYENTGASCWLGNQWVYVTSVGVEVGLRLLSWR